MSFLCKISHDWAGCTCRRCGETKHEVENCTCVHCKETVHQWRARSCADCFSKEHVESDGESSEEGFYFCNSTGIMREYANCPCCVELFICENCGVLGD